jgi:hypothetical protein
MASNIYAKDRAFSDRYIPAIKQIVGPHLLQEAPLEVDQREATDLIVMRARAVTIAARVRRPGYAEAYPFEFTIRAARASGVTTELEKIRRHWGEMLFYGHAAEQLTFSLWWLIDLNEFRYALQDNECRRCLRSGERLNKDGVTSFRWFDLRSFPPHRVSILIASSRPLDFKDIELRPEPAAAPPPPLLPPEPYGDLFGGER